VGKPLGEHLKELSVGKFKMDLKDTEWDVDWISEAQKRDQWRSLLSTIMNFQIP
jgi:hypothetical protein